MDCEQSKRERNGRRTYPSWSDRPSYDVASPKLDKTWSSKRPSHTNIVSTSRGPHYRTECRQMNSCGSRGDGTHRSIVAKLHRLLLCLVRLSEFQNLVQRYAHLVPRIEIPLPRVKEQAIALKYTVHGGRHRGDKDRGRNDAFHNIGVDAQFPHRGQRSGSDT